MYKLFFFKSLAIFLFFTLGLAQSGSTEIDTTVKGLPTYLEVKTKMYAEPNRKAPKLPFFIPEGAKIKVYQYVDDGVVGFFLTQYRGKWGWINDVSIKMTDEISVRTRLKEPNFEQIISEQLNNYIPNQRAFLNLYFGDPIDTVNSKLFLMKQNGKVDWDSTKNVYLYTLPINDTTSIFKIEIETFHDSLIGVSLKNKSNQSSYLGKIKLKKLIEKKYGEISYHDKNLDFWFINGKVVTIYTSNDQCNIEFGDLMLLTRKLKFIENEKEKLLDEKLEDF